VSRIASDIACALDPVALAESIGMLPDAWQAKALRSTHPRQLYNCSRQSGKSQTASVLATHVAVYEPGALVLLLSPSQRQSGELFKKVLSTYKSLGRPVDATAENALSLTLESGSRIVSLPGSEATIRSYSAVRLLIVDEASRVDDETMAACRPFLAVSGGQLIALSTPAGCRGWWHEAWENGGAAWERYRVPAAEVPRISAEFLASERAALGPYFYAQEYECSFESSDAALFDAETLRKMWDARVRPLFPIDRSVIA
jgi:hypothetical protein